MCSYFPMHDIVLSNWSNWPQSSSSNRLSAQKTLFSIHKHTAEKHTSTQAHKHKHTAQKTLFTSTLRVRPTPIKLISVLHSDKDCLQKWILAKQVEGPLSLHYIRPEDLQVDAPYGLKQIRLESSNWFVNSCKTSLKVLCPYIMSEHKILKWMFHHCSIWTETDTTGKLPWRDKITAIRAAIPQVDDSHILSVKNYPLLTWQL